MRLACPEQRLDCLPLGAVTLNLNCRDEIIPILRGLQHLYSNAPLRRELLTLVIEDAAGFICDYQVNGDNVIVEGNGHDNVNAGNGDNLIVAGQGQHNVQVGNGSNILIDGGVQLTQSGDSLRQVLDDWILYGDEAANVAGIRSRLSVTYNAHSANTLHAGSGLDWFWATDTQDHLNVKKTDLLN